MKKLARKIRINNKFCNWITCIENQIVFFCNQYINLKICDFISWIDYNRQVLKTTNLPYGVYDLDIIENRVYCTFNDGNHVTYTTFSGVTNTCYTSLNLMEKCKITVEDSMIFLLERDRDSVYNVDVNSKQRSVFHKDEIANPTHINFDRKTRQLAVMKESVLKSSKHDFNLAVLVVGVNFELVFVERSLRKEVHFWMLVVSYAGIRLI